MSVVVIFGELLLGKPNYGLNTCTVCLVLELTEVEASSNQELLRPIYALHRGGRR
jgi:hypothetical protein